jgi:hypothetical protein
VIDCASEFTWLAFTIATMPSGKQHRIMATMASAR